MHQIEILEKEYQEAYTNKKNGMIQRLQNDQIYSSTMTSGSTRLLELFYINSLIDTFKDDVITGKLTEILSEFDSLYEDYTYCVYERNAYFELRDKLLN